MAIGEDQANASTAEVSAVFIAAARDDIHQPFSKGFSHGR